MGSELEDGKDDEEKEQIGEKVDKLFVTDEQESEEKEHWLEDSWRPKTRDNLARVVVPTILTSQNLKQRKNATEEPAEEQMINDCVDQVGSWYGTGWLLLPDHCSSALLLCPSAASSVGCIALLWKNKLASSVDAIAISEI